MKQLVLPSWAALVSQGLIAVDAGQMYPEILQEMGIVDINQEALVIAQEVAKKDIAIAVAGTDAAPNAGGALVITINDDEQTEDGSKWAFHKWPIGDGMPASEVRKHGKIRDYYQRIRGFNF